MSIVVGQPEAGLHCHQVEICGEVHYAYAIDSSESIRLIRESLSITGTQSAKVVVVDAPPTEVVDAIAAQAEKDAAFAKSQEDEKAAAEQAKADADAKAKADSEKADSDPASPTSDPKPE